MFTPEYLNSDNMEKVNSFLEQNAESIKAFITDYKNQFELDYKFSTSSCLELGCGIGSLSFFLETLFHSVKGIDISSLAIASAKSIAQMKNSYLDFCVADLCSKEFDLYQKFDFIIDSHLFHCIIEDEKRKNYFKNIKKHLTPGGKIMIETMVFQPKMQFPIGHFYDENKTLWVDNEYQHYPIRKILHAKEIEQFILDQGCTIEYFFYHNELSFHPFDHSMDYPEQYCPKTLRICASYK